MDLDRLVKSIVRNNKNNRKIVYNIIKSNLFIDDVINDVILTIITKVNNGSIDINDITYNDNINYSYLKTLLVNRSIDFNKKSINKDINVDDFSRMEDMEDDEKPEWSEYKIHPLDYIEVNLERFSRKSLSNDFHVKVFRYYFYEGISISKLSRDTNISRKVLSDSKDYMMGIIKEWVSHYKKRDI
jgi:hypothetical protein